MRLDGALVALSGWATLPHPGEGRGGPVDLGAVRRVLVVRADNAGDVVATEPMLRAVRAAAPRARLDLLTSPAGAAAAAMIDAVDGTLVCSPSWQQLGTAADPTAEHALLAQLGEGRYDVLLAVTSASQSPWPVAALGLLAGIPVRVVMSAEFGGAVATHWVPSPPLTTHQTDRALALLAGIGVPERGRVPLLRVPAPECSVPDGSFAVLAPGASCPSRRYPAPLFGAAAARLAAAGLPVLVAGPATEAGLVAEVVRTAGHADVAAAPVLPLTGFTALLARAAVAVVNNSGGLHLAAAVGTPVAVALAGTERPDDVRPRGVASALLTRPVACSPCRQLTCPYQHECLDVPPAELAAAALRLARARPARPTEEIPWSPPVPTP